MEPELMDRGARPCTSKLSANCSRLTVYKPATGTRRWPTNRFQASSGASERRAVTERRHTAAARAGAGRQSWALQEWREIDLRATCTLVGQNKSGL
eukprot:352953-Chlamydomonas_euryale.AAC.1